MKYVITISVSGFTEACVCDSKASQCVRLSGKPAARLRKKALAREAKRRAKADEELAARIAR